MFVNTTNKIFCQKKKYKNFDFQFYAWGSLGGFLWTALTCMVFVKKKDFFLPFLSVKYPMRGIKIIPPNGNIKENDSISTIKFSDTHIKKICTFLNCLFDQATNIQSILSFLEYFWKISNFGENFKIFQFLIKANTKLSPELNTLFFLPNFQYSNKRSIFLKGCKKNLIFGT